MDNKSLLMEKLVGSLDKIEIWINSAESLLIKEAPIFIQEFLLYHTVISILNIVYCAIITLVFCIVFVIFGKRCGFSLNYEEDFSCSVYFFSALGVVVSVGVAIPVILNSISDLIKITFAPRLFLIEELGKFINAIT